MYGDSLDKTVGNIRVTYEDKSTELISLNECTLSGFDSSTTGEQTITVTYQGKVATYSVNVEEIQLERIEIKQEPIKNLYYEGDTIDTRELVLKGINNNGSTFNITSGFECSPTILTEVGEQIITVKYQGKVTTYSVNVEEIQLERIEIKQAPSKSLYYIGDMIDTTGLVLKGTNNNGTTFDIASEFECSPTILTEVGEQTITVKYQEKIATYSVNVLEVQLEKIEVEQAPSKSLYYIGDMIDSTGLVLKGTNNNGTTFDITSEFECSPTILTEAGEQTITVRYQGKTATYSVNVLEVQLDKIEVKQKPNKNSYYEGDLLDTTGLVLTVTNNNGNISDITSEFECSPEILTEAGEQTITVRYQGKVATYSVNVEKVQLERIEIKHAPNKNLYYEGDMVDTTGLVLTVTNNNGSTFDITSDFECSPTILTEVGEQTITVRYQDKTTTYSVNVEEVQLERIEVKQEESKNLYYEGDTIDISKLVLKGINNNGSTFDITSEFECSPTILTEVGEQTITIRYQGKTTTYNINVEKPSLTSIAYIINEEEKEITKVSPNITFGELLKNIDTNGIIKAIRKDNKELEENDLVGTSSKIIVEFGEKSFVFEVVVTGDMNGDGKVTAADLTALNKHLVGLQKLKGVFEKASDINLDEKVTAADLTKLNKAIVGLITI